MSVPVEGEELVRRAEYNVNKVWNAWRNDFSRCTPKELLAMVAFQFAKSYYQLFEQVEAQQKTIEEFEAELDRLLKIGNPDSDDSAERSH